MSGQIVYRKPLVHHCSPNTEGRNTALNFGDIWQCCDCGRTWIATDAPSNHATVGQRTCHAIAWRQEGRFARWRRTRRETRP